MTTLKKGVPMLYVQLSKALYGMLRAALLFYKKLRSDLENMGFKINPYDPCVADENTVTAFALKLAKIHEPKTTISRGKVHEYLGFDIDWGSVPGTMIVSMIKYLYQIIEEIPEVLRGTKPTPARDHLFMVRDEEDRKVLPEEQARQFHRTTAQLLFLCKRARPDIESLVSFLTSRVKQTDKDDWGKLIHGLMYPKGTPYMKRHLTTDLLNMIQ